MQSSSKKLKSEASSEEKKRVVIKSSNSSFITVVSFPPEHENVLKPIILESIENKTFETTHEDFDTKIKFKFSSCAKLNLQEGSIAFESSSFNAPEFIKLNMLQAKKAVQEQILLKAPELKNINITFSLFKFLFEVI